jgi:hypothetical protein
VLRWSLIGNPVKTGDGPAAVTSFLSLAEKRELFQPLCATVLIIRWKAAERARVACLDFSPQFRGHRLHVDLEDKKGIP